MRPESITIYRDGRETLNIRTVAGQKEYESRIAQMIDRQNGVCCLYGHIPDCPGRLTLDEATFEHEDGRGMGGGRRDDRIEKDGKRINGAAHFFCNGAKGSRRIDYN